VYVSVSVRLCVCKGECPSICMTAVRIQVNFVMIPREVRIRQHKLTRIVVIKIFAINLYHHSHFLAAPLISQLFIAWIPFKFLLY